MMVSAADAGSHARDKEQLQHQNITHFLRASLAITNEQRHDVILVYWKQQRIGG